MLSVLNASKYPPSLVFLLMTLGPALLLLALLERAPPPLADRLATFGRVPLFFYVSHLVVARLLAGAVALLLGFDLTLLPKDPVAAGWGFGLPVVYAAWIGVVAALYPACRRFAGLKARRGGGWLSYSRFPVLPWPPLGSNRLGASRHPALSEAGNRCPMGSLKTMGVGNRHGSGNRGLARWIRPSRGVMPKCRAVRALSARWPARENRKPAPDERGPCRIKAPNSAPFRA